MKGFVYVVGESGAVFRQNDNAGPWNDVSVPNATSTSKNNLVLVKPGEPEKFCITTFYTDAFSSILYSHDKGASYSIPTGDYLSHDIRKYNDIIWVGDKVYLLTDQGKIFVSTDDFASFNFVSSIFSQVVPTATSYDKIYSNDGITFLVGACGASGYNIDSYMFYQSTDGCLNWTYGGDMMAKTGTTSQYGDSFYYRQIACIWFSQDSQSGLDKIVIYGDRTFFESADGGVTFTMMEQEPIWMKNSFFYNENLPYPDKIGIIGGNIRNKSISTVFGTNILTSSLLQRQTSVYIKDSYSVSFTETIDVVGNRGEYSSNITTIERTFDDSYTFSVEKTFNGALLAIDGGIYPNDIVKIKDCLTGEETIYQYDSSLRTPTVNDIVKLNGKCSEIISVSKSYDNYNQIDFPSDIKIYENCSQCNAVPFILEDCEDPNNKMTVFIYEISYLDDKIYKVSGSDKCWKISGYGEATEETNAVTITDCFRNCEKCLGENCNYEDEPVSQYEPLAQEHHCSNGEYNEKRCKFANVMTEKMKEEKYGIKYCCKDDFFKVVKDNIIQDINELGYKCNCNE